jgi:hypothetical protein
MTVELEPAPLPRSTPRRATLHHTLHVGLHTTSQICPPRRSFARLRIAAAVLEAEPRLPSPGPVKRSSGGPKRCWA